MAEVVVNPVHHDCTCCRHWRAVEQPSAYAEGNPVPYAMAKDMSSYTVADIIKAGGRVRLAPPELPR